MIPASLISLPHRAGSLPAPELVRLLLQESGDVVLTMADSEIRMPEPFVVELRLRGWIVADKENPIWWIELIKVSPGLITAALAVGVVVAYRHEIRALFSRMTKFKALGIEAEFSAKTLDNAIAAQNVAVSTNDRKGALQRLQSVGSLLRDARILWVDDRPADTRNERALLERYGARITTVLTSVAAEQELRDNEYLLVITDLKREGKDTEGLEFVERIVASKTYRWTVAYVGTDQRGKPRPANLFAITNRPDHLIHYVCDIAERERL